MGKLQDLLGSSVADRRYAAVAYGYNPANGASLFFPTSTNGFVSLPTDPIANIHFAPRINTLPTFERSLFSTGKLSGRSSSNKTQIVFSNSDGVLDFFYNIAWAGRALELYIGGEGFSFAEHGLITVLLMEEPAFADDSVTIPLQDVSIYLDRDIQTIRYAGTGGAEGTTDLANKLKPDAWGCCRKVPPVYLGLDGNGRHQFGVGSGPIVGVLGVWDRGSGLVLANDPAAPAAGEYIVDVNTGTITLGGSFVGPIQVDVVGRRYLSIASASTATLGLGSKTFAVAAGATEAQFSIGMRVRCLLASDPAGTWMDGTVTARGGAITVDVDSGRAANPSSGSSWILCPWGTAAGILYAMVEALGAAEANGFQDTAARVALNNAQPATCGVWVPEGQNGLQLLDLFAEGSGCFWYITRANTFRAGRVDAPSGEPVDTLDEKSIISIQRLSTDEPNYQAVIKFGRRWSTLATDQLAGVASSSPASAVQFTEEWFSLIGRNDSIKRVYLTSKPFEVETVFDTGDAAYAELIRQFNLFGVKRDYFRVRLKKDFLTFALTNVVFVKHPRYGLGNGKLLRIVDLKEDYDAGYVEIGVWG